MLGALLALCTCARPIEELAPHERAAQVGPILEAVLRYELHQFGDSPAADRRVCLAVQEAAASGDPSSALLVSLSRVAPVRAVSECHHDDAVVLTAGPLDWLSDGELRVHGRYSAGRSISTPLLYRVVWQAGRWDCVGPILSYDPL